MALKLLINSLFSGGAERQFAALSSLLPHDALFLLENETSQAPAGSKPIILSSHGPSTPSVLKTAYIPFYARRLAALAALAGPGDTVLSFMERANIVNILAARQSGHRAVICERTRPSGEFSGLRGALMRPLIKRFYPLADVIVANSQGVKKDLSDIFFVPAEKIKVIPNGCDTTGIAEKAARPLDAAYDAVFKRPVVITSGRLTAAKGQWHLLRFFKKVKARRPDAALVLLGEGELGKYLERLSLALGLKTFTGAGAPPPDADVYFPGFRENPYQFLARARVFVFTSLWEGFPNALIEAMASGAPALSADCAAGPREILSPETPFYFRTLKAEPAPYGLLMPVPSGLRRPAAAPLEPAEEIWADMVSDILGDQEALRRYAGAGRRRAEDFKFSKTAQLWQELLLSSPSLFTR
jgi:glycosyltransferase involved in cell wall biosynthesis